jgi:subtilisin family serine protease
MMWQIYLSILIHAFLSFARALLRVVSLRRRGVAYKAQILAYKVAGSCKVTGSVSTNATLAAIQEASDDGADVLNLSYGDFRSGSYTDMRYANALGKAMQKGALVAIASGNDGAFGKRSNLQATETLCCCVCYRHSPHLAADTKQFDDQQRVMVSAAMFGVQQPAAAVTPSVAL